MIDLLQPTAPSRSVLGLLRTEFTLGTVTVSVPDALELNPGDFALVRVTHGEYVATIADICCGLLTPRAGKVQFLGYDWANITRERASLLRGRIGRVFESGNWLSFLRVIDNIELPRRHHERQSGRELRAQAALLADHFGLPGAPIAYPRETSSSDLRRAACVKAFLGRPELVLLEEPTTDLYPELMEPLINAIRSVRDRGGAVLWLTRDPAIWNDRSVPVDHRLRLVGSEMQVL